MVVLILSDLNEAPTPIKTNENMLNHFSRLRFHTQEDNYTDFFYLICNNNYYNQLDIINYRSIITEYIFTPDISPSDFF